MFLPYHVAKGTFKRPIPYYQFLGATADDSNATTYTFTAQNLGRPNIARIIVVAVHGEDALATFTFNSGTINGVTGTAIATGAPADTIVSGMMYAYVPNGNSGSIAVTWSEPITSCAIGVYALYYYRDESDPGEATGTGAMNAGLGDFDTQPYLLTIGASTNVGGETATWTTENSGAGQVIAQYDAQSAELGYSGASVCNGPGVNTRNTGLSVDWSGTGTGDLVAKNFYPSYFKPRANIVLT